MHVKAAICIDKSADTRDAKIGISMYPIRDHQALLLYG